jgi:cell division protein ZapA (FtsZ GTPase activity inhibitor)
MAPSVTRALQSIKRYAAAPDQIDNAILAAINVTLCIVSRGNDRVAEGFNRDIALSGRSFRTPHYQVLSVASLSRY